MTLAETKGTEGSTLAFILGISCKIIPEIGHTIYLILMKIVSEVL